MRSIEEAQTWWSGFERYGSISELRENIEAAQEPAVIVDGGRSAIWKAFLLFNDIDLSKWPQKLEKERQAFIDLRERFLKPLEQPAENNGPIDPLSDDFNSPWDALRKDEQLKQEIIQDVERCLPENLYFRQPNTQALLVDILFVWAKLNPDVGYRQGMHELLAPILWVVEKDSVDPKGRKTIAEDEDSVRVISDVFDFGFIGHDAFAIFTKLMQQVKASYDIHDAGAQSLTRKRIGIVNSQDTTITERSRSILEDYLARIDPPLERHLKEIGVVPQVFLIRWVRLLFIREFIFGRLLELWDRLIIEDVSTVCIDLVCISMLLRIRWQLLEANESDALQLLLHYPELPLHNEPWSLVDDASFLKSHLDYHGGSHIISKRTNRSPSGMDFPTAPRNLPSTPTHKGLSSQSTSIEALFREAARGINTRGEKWGVYQAVRDVTSEIRKNVSTLQSRTHSRMQSLQGSSGLVGGETSEDLLNKPDELNIRNTSLAKMLEDAVAELWQQQHMFTAERAGDNKQAEAFTTAVAKVQFVQIYLEDSSLRLPAHGLNLETSEIPHQKAEARPSGDDIAWPSENPAASNLDSALDHTRGLAREIPDVSSGVPGSQGSRTSSSQGTPLRPLLEQSSYSWMLGQESSANTLMPRSSVFSPSSNSNQRLASQRGGRGSTAYLFGEEDPDLS